MSQRTHEPPAAFLVIFYGVLVLAGGMAFRAGWELMGWMIQG